MALTRRRTLLAGAAFGSAALLTACSDDTGAAPAHGSADADRLRADAARASTTLLARYDATLAAHPPLAARLRPLRAEVARHAQAFGATTPSPKPSAPTVPTSEKAARTALADAERTLSDTRAKALRTAPPELARLLASVSAAGAAHAYLLTTPTS